MMELCLVEMKAPLWAVLMEPHLVAATVEKLVATSAGWMVETMDLQTVEKWVVLKVVKKERMWVVLKVERWVAPSGKS